MRLVPTNPKVLHLLIRYFDSGFVLVDVQDRFHFQAAARPRSPNQVDDTFVTPKRLPFPGQTNEGEQSMLHPIPLARSRRVVTNGNRLPHLIGESLQVDLPGSPPAAVTSPAIRADQHPPRLIVAPPTIHFPPASDTLDRELCRIMRNPHVHYRQVLRHIIGAVRDRTAFRWGGKIVDIDGARVDLSVSTSAPGSERLPPVLSSSYR